MGWKQITLATLGIVTVVTLSLYSSAFAQSTSTNYKVEEVFFGTGGQRCVPGETGSSSYCADMSAGEMTVGNTESANYQAQAGFNTSDVPFLEVATSGAVDFGLLNTNSIASGSASVQVRTYLASGYVMRITGTAPSYTTGGTTHSLDTPTTPTNPAAGTEQFGINLRANTTPSVGADPVQVPDDSFSFGVPAADYNVPNMYMYNDGSIVAYSDSSTGQTNYTISMIANMSSTTAAGKYTTNLSMVVIATF